MPGHLTESFRSLSVRIAFLLHAGLAVLLTQVPLFNQLGYEFSVAIALATSIISPFLTIGRKRKWNRMVQQDQEIPHAVSLLSIHLLLLVPPLAIILLNGINVWNCSLLEGLTFYLLIPVVTAVFSHALAFFCFNMFQRAYFSYFVLLAILLIAYPLWVGYSTPAIFSYSFIYGYFPGFTYDEVLRITPTLILFRLITIVLAVLIWLAALLASAYSIATKKSFEKVKVIYFGLRNQKRLGLPILVLIVGLFATWLYRDAFGFESSERAITHSLDHAFVTDHFVIRYKAGSISEEEIRWIAAEHEFRLYQVVTALRVQMPRRIDSYIYPTFEDKRRFVGAAQTNIAKPWRNEIHLGIESWSHVLKHELVHIMAGTFGLPIVRANHRTGLTEGLAMAVEWDFGNRTLHEYAAEMKQSGLMRDVCQLMGLIGFASQSSSVSYVLSGSFIRFLIDRYGMDTLKSVYAGSSFSGAFGKDLTTLAGEWETWLDSLSSPHISKGHIGFFFDRKPIFARKCVRFVARLNEDADALLREGDAHGALEGFRSSFRVSPNSEALSGLVRSAFRAGLFDTVASIMERTLADTVHRNSALHLLPLYGDALWANGEVKRAQECFSEAFDLGLSDYSREFAAHRLSLLLDDSLSSLMGPLLIGASDSLISENFKSLNSMSNNPMIELYLAESLSRRGNSREAYEVLVRIPDIEARNTLDSSVAIKLERLRGKNLFRTHRFADAELHFAQALRYTTNEATRLRLKDWIERCRMAEQFDMVSREADGSREKVKKDLVNAGL